MLKRSLLALAAVAVTAATISASRTTAPVIAEAAPDVDDHDHRRPRPPHPPRPPHRRPPDRGPRCVPPVAEGVLPTWAHEQRTVHNARVLELFDADHNGELNVEERHAHLRARHHGAPDHERQDNERFALVSASEREELIDGANALSRVILRLPLWLPLWVASAMTTTSENNKAVQR